MRFKFTFPHRKRDPEIEDVPWWWELSDEGKAGMPFPKPGERPLPPPPTISATRPKPPPRPRAPYNGGNDFEREVVTVPANFVVKEINTEWASTLDGGDCISTIVLSFPNGTTEKDIAETITRLLTHQTKLRSV